MSKKEEIINSIKSRISAEYRKHKSQDWARIASIKIYSTYLDKKINEGKNTCKECGEYFKKKEIIIQGDKNTCDKC